MRGRSRNTRRDDPRRHTLGADQQYMPMAGQGGQLARTMDLEVSHCKIAIRIACLRVSHPVRLYINMSQ